MPGPKFDPSDNEDVNLVAEVILTRRSDWLNDRPDALEDEFPRWMDSAATWFHAPTGGILLEDEAGQWPAKLPMWVVADPHVERAMRELADAIGRARVWRRHALIVKGEHWADDEDLVAAEFEHDLLNRVREVRAIEPF